MKKIFLAGTILTLISCQNIEKLRNYTYDDNNVSMYENSNKERIIKMVGENTYSNIVIQVSENGEKIKLNLDGKEYNLYKIVSASGDAYESLDKRIYLGIKGNKAILEKDDKIETYINLDDFVETTKKEIVNEYFNENNSNDLIRTKTFEGSDEIELEIYGRKYVLNRVISASGEAYESLDKRIYLGIKNNDALVEIDDNIEVYRKIGTHTVNENDTFKVSKIVKYRNTDNMNDYLVVNFLEDEDKVKVDFGNHKEYVLDRVMSASGEAFESEDKTIYLGLKRDEAVLEVNNQVKTYKDVVSTYSSYEKTEKKQTLEYISTDNRTLIVDLFDDDEFIEIEFENKKYELNRIVSASGEAFESEDKKIYLGLKGKNAYLEFYGREYNFTEISNYKSESYESYTSTYNNNLEVFNFKSLENNRVSKALFIKYNDGDFDYLRVDGKDYKVKRIYQNNLREVFESENKKVYIEIEKINGNLEAYIEINDKGIRYKDAGSKLFDYAR